MITARQAQSILRKLKGVRILVIGDLMLDRYLSGTVNRISPEAPVPVIHLRDEYARPGGAANVAINVQALGARGVVSGAVGRDQSGAELMELLRQRGIGTAGVIRTRRVSTIVKTRVIAERQQVVRVDREDPPGRVTKLVAASLVERIWRCAAQASGIIIEDYGKGVICQEAVDTALAVAAARGIPVGLDPKDNHELRFHDLTLATPNYKEACLAAGLREEPLSGDLVHHATLRRAGDILLKQWGCRLLMITLGSHGMYLRSGSAAPVVIPTKAREVFDVTGAGDTVIAAAMAALAVGASFSEAAAIANYAAGVVVGKLGAATSSPDELLDGME